MANIKSAKKRAKQTIERHKRNITRKSSIKTAVKKVLISLESGDDLAKTKELLKDAESILARAKGKGLIHPKTAARRVSRLSKKVSARKP